MADGVLHTPPAPSWRVRRWDPPAASAGVVGCAWASEWTLPAGRTHVQSVLPHPAANLVLEDGRVTFFGPASERFDRTLSGTGRVIGVRFRPAMVSLLTGRPAVDIADATLPADDLGLDGETLAHRLAGIADAEDAGAALLAALDPVLDREPDPVAVELRDGVELAEHDLSIHTVDEFAARLHRSRRTLQRQFAEHVGLSPAWVLRRYRLRRTLDEADTGADDRPDWAAIAQRVGYYDQAHLVRDFSNTVGAPPHRYLRRPDV